MTIQNQKMCIRDSIKTTVTLTQDLQELFMSDAEAEAAGKEKLTVTLSVGDKDVYKRQMQ